jgi:hypothetical protein
MQNKNDKFHIVKRDNCLSECKSKNTIHNLGLNWYLFNNVLETHNLVC